MPLNLERLEDRCNLNSCGGDLHTFCPPYDYIRTMFQPSEGVIVAVIDSGVNCYPTLKCVPGWDYVDHDDKPDDPRGHGTAMASLIAEPKDGRGIVGTAPGATIMPLRVLDEHGRGFQKDAARAIRYATDNGASVINLSLGTSLDPRKLMTRAVEYAAKRGVTVVAAAGSFNGPVFPAKIERVISVSGLDYDLDRLMPRSFIGDVGAPGNRVKSRAEPGVEGGYQFRFGTSVAAALVSGAVASAYADDTELTDYVVQRRIAQMPLTEDGQRRLDVTILRGEDYGQKIDSQGIALEYWGYDGTDTHGRPLTEDVGITAESWLRET